MSAESVPAPPVITRRNFPAETWAVVRDAYLGGETAESIGRRLKMSVNTIRKRATRRGWTHAAHAAALERESQALTTVDAEATLEQVTSRAARLLVEGRAAEAQALIRAAEGLRRLTGGGRPAEDDADDETPEAPPPDVEALDADLRARAGDASERAAVWLSRQAEDLVHQILCERPEGVRSILSPFVYRFRALHFGPEIAARDRAHAIARGWGDRLWDAEGRLKDDAATDARALDSLSPAPGGCCCAWMAGEEARAAGWTEDDD